MRLCLAGCSPMTGNLGVSALCYSTLRALFAEVPDVDLSVMDHGWGERKGTLTVDGKVANYRRLGMRLSKRYWRAESLWNIRISSRFGGLHNPSARAICEADAVLDISGGDSFTDIYGAKRFRTISLIKKIALEARRPLVLLPQTYGPYRDSASRLVAEQIVRQSTMAWARDEESFGTLKTMAGADFEPAKYRCGVDVAFDLESIPPDEKTRDETNLLDGRAVGFNVSGLIYNGNAQAARQYGLKADYKELVLGFLRKMLAETSYSIVLVPHVTTQPGHYESDVVACERVLEELGPAAEGRVTVLPALSDPRHVKWVISHFEWFCGTRMHSTIAGLSTKVPTAAIAYSGKTRGVFGTCGVVENVVDPRVLETNEAIHELWEAWMRRKETKAKLERTVPGVIARAREQIRDIVAQIRCESSEAAAPVTTGAAV